MSTDSRLAATARDDQVAVLPQELAVQQPEYLSGCRSARRGSCNPLPPVWRKRYKQPGCASKANRPAAARPRRRGPDDSEVP